MHGARTLIFTAWCSLATGGMAIAQEPGRLTLDAPSGKKATLVVETMELKPREVGQKHAHSAQPCAFYVLEGVVTEGRGTTSRDYKVGQSFKIEENTEHWFENKGAQPARYLSMCL